MLKQDIKVTVDAVIFYKSIESQKVLLIKRKNNPFKGEWALPGGYLENHESLEQGALRELEEETGLKLTNLKQVGIFASPERDPRGRTISIAFTDNILNQPDIKANDDAIEVNWCDLKNLPKLAFDHLEIINKAKTI